MTTRPRTLVGLGLAALAASLAGCGGMGRFDLDVTLNGQAFQTTLGTIPSVELNFIGVNDSEMPVWTNYSINKYWMPDNPQRITAVSQAQALAITFSENPPYSQTISRTNTTWNKWKSKGAMHLIVVANYPRTSNDAPGDADVRRIVLPLAKRRWKSYFWGRRTIRIEVTPSGIVNHTPPKPLR